MVTDTARYWLWIGGARQIADMVVHAVVVVEEAIAHPQKGVWWLTANVRAGGFGLCVNNATAKPQNYGECRETAN
jgi:hypothetical protein